MTTERIIDLSDVATAAEEKFREAAVSVRQPEGPRACGHCHNCDAPLAPDLRWCDATCRDEWEVYQAHEQQELRAAAADED
jgi:hypothetical protein